MNREDECDTVRCREEATKEVVFDEDEPTSMTLQYCDEHAEMWQGLREVDEVNEI
jgi:hypothetical protein